MIDGTTVFDVASVLETRLKVKYSYKTLYSGKSRSADSCFFAPMGENRDTQKISSMIL